MALAYCGTCGNPVHAAFCSVCGRPAPSGLTPEQTATQVPAAVPPVVVPPPDVAPPVYVPPRPTPLPGGQPGLATGTRPARPAWLLPVLSSVLVVALAAVGYVLWGARNGGPAGAVATGAVGGTVGAAPTAANPAVTSAPPKSQAPTPSSTPPPSSTPAPTPPVDPRQAAYDRLEELVRQDSTKNVVRGQWVAQLASKYEGIVDPLVRTQPYTVPEILAEHEALRSHPEFGPSVRLLHQGDWGRAPAHNPPMWVTVADFDARSAAAVRAWCESRFPQRGKALENVCYARQLTPRGT